MRGLKVLLGAVAIVAAMALMPASQAQVVVGIGGPPPICSYGYYEYPPYACAPVGFYGPGYFYNGIFLGVGPWRNWGYGHGWGGHRFVGGGGGRYVARGGYGRGGYGRGGYGRGGYRGGEGHGGHGYAGGGHADGGHAGGGHPGGGGEHGGGHR